MEKYYLVVGSRTFNDYEMMKRELDKLIAEDGEKEITIVSGGARGADSLAEAYADEKGFKKVVMPADWNKYGKKAGYIRNEEMHKYIASKTEKTVIAFWDGVSKGTQHNFGLCARYKNPLKVIRFK